MLFLVSQDIPDLYLFHLIVLLNPVFNFFNNLLSFSVDNVTTGIYNYVAAILKVVFVGLLISATQLSPAIFFIKPLLVNTKLADQVKVKDTLQLIKVICSALQKLVRYFNGTAISTSFSLVLSSNSPC